MSELRFNAIQTKGPKIDPQSRVIRDVILCEVGEARSYGLHIEESFIDDLVSFSTSKFPKVPSHFTHSARLGTQAGNILNVRKDGKKAIGDLHIYESADKSPELPNMGEYIFSIAKEDKKAINLSIAFDHEYYYQKDKSGNQIKIWYWDQETGWVSKIKEYGKVYIKFKQLYRADLVSNGAATTKLFSSTPELRNQMLDLMNHEDFMPMMETHFEDFTQLNEFFSQKHKESTPGWLAKMLGVKSQSTQLSDKSTTMDKPKETPETPKTPTELQGLQDQITELKQQLDDKTTELSSVQEKLKDLEKAPAAQHTELGDPGASKSLQGEAKDSIMALDINQRAMKMFETMSKPKKSEDK